MTSLLAVLGLGFLLGMRHATDPDHVIAVTTIVSRHRKAGIAAFLGAAWGVGHTLTILLVGGGIILFQWVIPPRLGLFMEFSVGLMLVLLGVLNLVRKGNAAAGGITEDHHQHGHPHLHTHAHAHGDYVHTHPHGHEPESHPHRQDQTPVSWLDRHFEAIRAYQLLRPLLVGVVHGLAGSAAIGLLVLTAIRDPAWGLLYLLVFGVGTIAGMMIITAAVAMPFAYTSNRFVAWNRGLRMATGLLSVAFGIVIAWRTGVVHGLFTARPDWTPK